MKAEKESLIIEYQKNSQRLEIPCTIEELINGYKCYFHLLRNLNNYIDDISKYLKTYILDNTNSMNVLTTNKYIFFCLYDYEIIGQEIILYFRCKSTKCNKLKKYNKIIFNSTNVYDFFIHL